MRLAMLAAVSVTATLWLAVPAGASPQVTIPGPYPVDGQTITVSGSGFPAHDNDPTGLAIIECADPDGTIANLPSSAALCDGTTVNPLQINTDDNGNFTARYQVSSLNGTHTSNIWCDQTHYCVLWVGVDFNNNFLGVHAFSTAFKVGAPGSAPGGSGVPAIAIWLPVAFVVVLVSGVVIGRRRGRPTIGGGDELRSKVSTR